MYNEYVEKNRGRSILYLQKKKKKNKLRSIEEHCDWNRILSINLELIYFTEGRIACVWVLLMTLLFLLCKCLYDCTDYINLATSMV